MKPTFEEVKHELVAKFDNKGTYEGGLVRATIMATSFKDCLQKEHIPSHIKKGDVLTLQEGAKRRPCVVLKVLKDNTVIYTTLTSTDNIHCLLEGDSRFFDDSCFAKTLGVCTEEYALENWVGVYDNDKLVNQAIRELKDYFNNNL